MRCPKCAAVSGDDWAQCRGQCPMQESPHFDLITAKRYTVSQTSDPDTRIVHFMAEMHNVLGAAVPWPDKAGPTVAVLAPGLRVVLLYERATSTGVWEERTPPRHGIVRSYVREGVYGTMVEIEWAHSGLISEMLLSAWYGAPHMKGCDVSSRTAFGPADDEANIRAFLRQRILKDLTEEHARSVAATRMNEKRLHRLLGDTGLAPGERRCNSCNAPYTPSQGERESIRDDQTTLHTCPDCPPF